MKEFVEQNILIYMEMRKFFLEKKHPKTSVLFLSALNIVIAKSC
jgi:hypothetical protein